MLDSSGMSFVQQYLEETQKVVAGVDPAALEKMGDELARVRNAAAGCSRRRGAANASHAVNDFHQDLRFEAAPTDNVSGGSAHQ